jgi:Sec-independent protein translocase protein TatA
MVSWGEIFVTLTAAGYLLGRKELPKLAHFAGTYTGRSIGAILRAKKEFFDATKDNELIKVSIVVPLCHV